MRFVSLHHHSTFSYGDGFGLPEAHIARAADLGYSAMALTEHGNVSSHVQLEKAARKAGVKPIFGLEAYTAPVTMRDDKNQRKWHLTLLAQNAEGYRNLMRLCTASWEEENNYRWPTITGPMLAEYSGGLIVLSGCSDSLLACSLLGGKGRATGSEADALRIIDGFKDLLGDRYYIEVQQFPELTRTVELNTWLAEAARRRGVQLAATADVHYPMPNDNEMQVILHTALRGGGTVEEAEASWEYGIRLTLPTEDKLLLKRLQATGLSKAAGVAAILATEDIASRCEVDLPKVERLRYPLPEGSTAHDLIWEWLRGGWEYRAQRNPALEGKDRQIYIDRVKYEMSVVEEKDFVDYFLMLSDIVRFAKDSGIAVGPARGSAAASLACYLLRITEIDPMPFPSMLFERFIDVSRSDIPDVDLDFDDERRDELRIYAEAKYGADHVANIMTTTQYKGKNSLIDVARVFSIPPFELNAIKNVIVERSGGDSRASESLLDTVAMFPQAQAVLDKYPDLQKAIRLEGNYRGWSTHAAGLVISNDPLTDNVAWYSKTTGTGRNKKTRNVLSVNKYDAEYLGLMKADFLGLSTMGMISRALTMIGVKLEDMYDVPLDDPRIIDAFNRNDVTGVFQFGGGATRVVNGDVKPDNFLELCDINALSRPGPLHSGSTADYISVKHGRKPADHIHPVVDRITQHTKFQIIYQEQILQLVREVGDFDWTHAQEIRKIISLKHGEAAFNMKVDLFIEGADRLHGIDSEIALKIWRKLATAGTYAFNAAHCVSYSMLAYWTMWLKVYHPQAFYAAMLIKFPDEADQFKLLRDAAKHAVEVAAPDLNTSGITWAVDGDMLRAGFAQVPGIGEVTAEAIVANREANGLYLGWPDLERVKGIGPKTMERIVGVSDSDDPFGIHAVDIRLGLVREAIEYGDLAGLVPRPTHRANEIPTDATKDLPLTWIGIPTARNPQDIVEDERARTGEDFEVIRKRLKSPNLVKKMAVVAIDDSDETVYLRFSRFVFPRFEKALWDMKLNHDIVIVRGKRLSMVMGRNVQVESMWVIDGDDL